MENNRKKIFVNSIIKYYILLTRYERKVKYFRLRDFVKEELDICGLEFDREFENVKKIINASVDDGYIFINLDGLIAENGNGNFSWNFETIINDNVSTIHGKKIK